MTETHVVPRLREKYEKEISPALKEKFKLRNPHQIAVLQKVVVNMGVGKAIENKKRIDAAARDMGTITGQKPQICLAKHSVAGFKVREGWPVGCRVTLRGDRMFEFIDRLFTLTIPRIRDFRGIKDKSFDGRGNFSMGLADQIVFPEINVDQVDWNQGMDITFVMTGGNDGMSYELLKQLGMPFRKNDEVR